MTGCMPSHQVKVNSIGSTQSDKKVYVLVSGNSNISNSDLQFKEFATYTKRALRTKGFVEGKEASIEIRLSYGMEKTQVTNSSFSTNVYGQTGVSSSSTQGRLTQSGNGVNYSGNTLYTPTYGTVGTRTYNSTTTHFISYIELEAIDIQASKIAKETVYLWKTVIRGRDDDRNLRASFPIILAAGMNYIGTNTTEEARIVINDTDKKVLKLKGK